MALAAALNRVKGRAALSGYDDEEGVMDQLYPAPKWHKVCFGEKQLPMSKGKGRKKAECLWMNYDIHEINGQLNLFR